MRNNLENLVRKPVSEMTFGERIEGNIYGPMPRHKKGRTEMLVRLMRSEVHLPSPAHVYKDFTPEMQDEILGSIEGMTNEQLAVRIREEKQRLEREFREQNPLDPSHPPSLAMP